MCVKHDYDNPHLPEGMTRPDFEYSSAASIRALLVCLMTAGGSLAQTVEVHPSVLARIPEAGLSEGRYFQQLRIEFGSDDAPSDTAVVIEMPAEVSVADTDGDTVVADEIRVKYDAIGDEDPRFFVSPSSTAQRIVVGSLGSAAAASHLYVQFPIASADVTVPPTGLTTNYGPISFADASELNLPIGPGLSIVSLQTFDTLGSLDVVELTAPLASQADTSTSEVGTVYPDNAAVLVESLPDLVFDSDDRTTSNLLPFSDGDDGNDTEYQFFLAPVGTLTAVDDSVAVRAVLADGLVYTETEGTARAVRLLTRHLSAGTYYLYVTADVTGTVPLARSRGLVVRHKPEVLEVGPSTAPITLDSGGLYDQQGERNGKGSGSTDLTFTAIDHDDSVAVHLFYSRSDDLGSTDVELGDLAFVQLGVATQLTGGAGLRASAPDFTWNVATPVVVPAGDYYIYAVAVGGVEVAIRRSTHQVRVRHSPFLRLDVLDDEVLEAADTLRTGGLRPQRFVTFTWGRSGTDGDFDLDGDASIDLYYSSKPAVAGESTDSELGIPAGAAELTTSGAQLIVSGIGESGDSRLENQYVWDLWDAGKSGPVPTAGQLTYVYGVIADSSDTRLVQMNGGRLNDAGSRLVFDHGPTLRPLQPYADITVQPQSSGRVSWEDEDLDSDASIRVILTNTDRGALSTYGTVTSGAAYIANSANGQAGSKVDEAFDLSEDAVDDFLDVRSNHLVRTVAGVETQAEGFHFVYLSIVDGDSFEAETPAQRTRGGFQFSSVGTATAGTTFQLLPEVFTIGTGGSTQRLEMRVDDAGEAVDLILGTIKVDGRRFTVIDGDTTVEGLQPFQVASGFSTQKLVTNTARAAENGSVYLSFEYFEATAPRIEGLDGERPLVTFELATLPGEGSANSSIDLEMDPESGKFSQLQVDGRNVTTPTSRPLSAATLMSGRGAVTGAVRLEGRTDMTAALDFSLRRWGNYEPVADSIFVAANDANPEADGVQVQLGPDGSFRLFEVPTGRLDLHAHFDGYLDAWFPAINLQPSQGIEGVLLTTSGIPADSLMLGGDVAGYGETDGTSVPDNEVTLADWDFAAALFDQTVRAEGDSGRADITGDGVVNIRDLALVGANFTGRGPRPVFKQVFETEGEVLVRTDLFPVGEVEGQARFAVMASSLVGIRAFQAAVEFDTREWALEGVDVGDHATAVLTAVRTHRWGERIAASLIGPEASWAGTHTSGAIDDDAERSFKSLATWRLRRLVEEAVAPELVELLLLDRSHREVDALMVGQRGLLATDASATPAMFALGQNYPNPFNPETTIPFSVPTSLVSASRRVESATGISAINAGYHSVSVEVYNALGQRQTVLVADELVPGSYDVRWNGRDQLGREVSSGVYFYRFRLWGANGSGELVRRMLLVR